MFMYIHIYFHILCIYFHILCIYIHIICILCIYIYTHNMYIYIYTYYVYIYTYCVYIYTRIHIYIYTVYMYTHIIYLYLLYYTLHDWHFLLWVLLLFAGWNCVKVCQGWSSGSWVESCKHWWVPRVLTHTHVVKRSQDQYFIDIISTALILKDW